MKKKLFVLLIIFLSVCFISLICYTHFIFLENMPVLAYHEVLENPNEETDVTLENFERQMRFLKRHHYRTLSLDEFYAWKNGENIPGKKILLTFDDGKESFYTTVLPILQKYGFKAVLFVVQDGIDQEGYISKEQLEELKKLPNIDVQSHSFQLHLDHLALSNDYQIYNEDLLKNKENHYEYYAYPFGIANENYVAALKENQYKLAFLFSPSKWANRKQDNYRITRVPIYKSNSLWKFQLKTLFKI